MAAFADGVGAVGRVAAGLSTVIVVLVLTVLREPVPRREPREEEQDSCVGP